jgi:colanic acid/amylovoran biosynthesis glycosyltransferase
MRIACFVANFPILSETFVRRHINGLIAAGHDVTVLTAKRLQGPTGIPASVPIIEYGGESPKGLAKLAAIVSFCARAPWSGTGRQRLRLVLDLALSRYLYTLYDMKFLGTRHLGTYDVILAHFGTSGVRAMYLQQARYLTGPITTVLHGYEMSRTTTISIYRQHYQRLFQRTPLLLPISDFWARRLRDWGAPESKIRVLRMGVEIGGKRAIDADRPIGRPLSILSVARMEEKKGLADAIAAVAQVRGDIRYSIIGTGPLDHQLRAMAQAVAKDRVAFLGALPHDQTLAAIAAADLFLLPSVTAPSGDMEGLPVVLMEAMARGVLVLSTRHSGIPELVQDNETGMLVNEADPEAIASRIQQLIDGKVDMAAIRLRAFERVRDHFDAEALDRDLAEILAGLAKKNHAHEIRI